MSEWQPIETAPKRTGILVGYFGDQHSVNGTMMVCHIEDPFVAGWPYVNHPTHWMPLPKAPAQNTSEPHHD